MPKGIFCRYCSGRKTVKLQGVGYIPCPMCSGKPWLLKKGKIYRETSNNGGVSVK